MSVIYIHVWTNDNNDGQLHSFDTTVITLVGWSIVNQCLLIAFSTPSLNHTKLLDVPFIFTRTQQSHSSHLKYPKTQDINPTFNMQLPSHLVDPCRS